jgi:hypothetical protein
VNTGASWPTLKEAAARVLGIQAKLHQWATDDPTRRFVDLFNLVGDPAFLLVGWRRVRGNKGARSAGVDGETAYYVESVWGEDAFLAELRASLTDRSFRPLPVRERMIPKPGSTKRRRLGIPPCGTAWCKPRSSWCSSRSSRRRLRHARMGLCATRRVASSGGERPSPWCCRSSMTKLGAA